MSERKVKREIKVLVVDSNREDLERTTAALREDGIRVVAVSRLEVVPALYEVMRPDAAVVACLLPDVTGLSAARRLRQLSRGTLPLFYVLEAEDESAKRYLLEKGRGADVLLKPVDSRELIAKIRSHVRLSRSIEKAMKHKSAASVGPGLEGVSDRSFLLTMMEHEARRAERHGGSFGVLVGVLEGLSQWSESHGAEFAQRLSAHAAQIFRTNIREGDILGAVSENGFALCLPGASPEGLPIMRSRIASAFHRSPLQIEKRLIKVSVALGTASFPDDVSAPGLLLGAAYQDLRRSRDPLQISGPSRQMM